MAPIVLVHAALADAASHTVAINGAPNCGTSMFCYSPSSLTVTAGDTVTWVNNSTAPHTVTPCNPSACSGSGPGRSGSQSVPSSPTIEPSGGTFTLTFTTPGKYKYYSAIHGHRMLRGMIRVVAATTTRTTANTTLTTLASSSTTTALTRAGGVRQLTGAFTYTVAINGAPNCGTSMFCYNPSSLAVNVGDTVDWVNNSTASQTITRCDSSTCSGNGPGSGGQSGPTSSTISAGGGSFSFTFTSPGTYNYFCAICGYAVVHGTITVDPATTVPTTGMNTTTIGSSSMNLTTMRMLSASSDPSSRLLGDVSTSGSAHQLAGTGNPMRQGVVVGPVLFLLGLGLTVAITARRRRSAQRPCVVAPESSLTIRLLQEIQTEGIDASPDAKVKGGPPLA
jgi:plastocyanin